MEEKMAYRAKRDTGPEGDIARRKLDQIKRARAEAEGKTFRARVKKGFSGFVSKVAGFFKKKPIAKVAMLMSAREELQSIIALDATGSDYAMAGISGYAGLKAIHASTPRLLGKQRFYHGTSKQNAEKIIKEGLDPEMGGKNGASAHVGSSSYVKNSTGHVHVTPSKRVAAAFSHLHGSGAGKGDPKQALAMLKGALLGTAGPGAIVSGHLDYDRFQRDFHPDPDMGGGQAYRTKTKIGTESIGSSVTKGVSAGSIAKYIKANPGRFAAGAGLAAAGGAGLAYGASRLLGKKPVSNMSAADELDLILFKKKAPDYPALPVDEDRMDSRAKGAGVGGFLIGPPGTLVGYGAGAAFGKNKKSEMSKRDKAMIVGSMLGMPGVAAASFLQPEHVKGNLFSAQEELDSIIQLAAWTRKEGKSRSGGLNEKGRKSYERENPGSDLKAPSKEAGNPRRASFCARMSGMKKKLTSSKTANDPDSRINKSLKAWNCSAREELNTILFAKKGGDYKRHWSQKKTDRKGKKKRADRGETPCECHTYSAREELEVIQFGLGSLFTGAGKKLGSVAGELAMPDALGGLGGQLIQGAKFATAGGVRGLTSGLKAGAEDAGGAIKNLWGKLKPAKSAYAPGMNPFQNSMVHASARDQLNTILMGVDVRPRDPMGRFDQAEDGAPNPQHMKVVYAAPQEQAPPSITGKNMGKLAAGGAAFMGGGMALQHLIEKLKKLKK